MKMAIDVKKVAPVPVADTYVLTLDKDDYEMIILALKYAYEHVDKCVAPSGSTRFAFLRYELENAR